MLGALIFLKFILEVFKETQSHIQLRLQISYDHKKVWKLSTTLYLHINSYLNSTWLIF